MAFVKFNFRQNYVVPGSMLIRITELPPPLCQCQVLRNHYNSTRMFTLYTWPTILRIIQGSYFTTLYFVSQIVYIVHCTLYSVHYKLYVIHTVHCTRYIFLKICWRRVEVESCVLLFPFWECFHPSALGWLFYLLLILNH